MEKYGYIQLEKPNLFSEPSRYPSILKTSDLNHSLMTRM